MFKLSFIIIKIIQAHNIYLEVSLKQNHKKMSDLYAPAVPGSPERPTTPPTLQVVACPGAPSRPRRVVHAHAPINGIEDNPGTNLDELLGNASDSENE